MATRADKRWSFEDYFAWEAEQGSRHEFIDGEVYAMTGGSNRHSRVIVALITQLHGALKKGPCAVFQGDAKLFVEAAGQSFYPDAFVCCDSTAMQARGVITDATAIFEVLSPRTALYDRTGKFADYRRLKSLRHYVLLDPEALIVEAFELIDGRWSIVEMAGRANIPLAALGIALSAQDLFDGIGEPLPPIGFPSNEPPPSRSPA